MLTSGSWSFSSDNIGDFILASHKIFFTKDDGEILIFHPSCVDLANNALEGGCTDFCSPYNGVWYPPIARPSRSWNSIILPESKKDEILKDVECFLSDVEKAWYASRGKWNTTCGAVC